MKKRTLMVLTLVLLVPAGLGYALDAIKTVDSTSVQGKITQVTSQKVVIETRGAAKEIPVSEIVSITYDGEPNELRLKVRTGIAGKSKYNDVLAVLEKLKPDTDTRKEVAQDIEFYKAVCMARLAIDGQGDIKLAGKALNAFIQANPDSYHYYEALELMGDMAITNRSYSSAVGFYGKLLATPWPAYQLRAGLALGRSYLIERKPQEALQAFEKMLSIQAKENDVHMQALAKAGKAQCLAELGKTDEAVKIAQDLIDNTSSSETEVHAAAYVALGTAYRAMKKPKEAAMAFLYVDLLYNSAADAHAQALVNLVQVWNDLKQPERAQRAKETLDEQYKTSPWAQ